MPEDAAHRKLATPSRLACRSLPLSLALALALAPGHRLPAPPPDSPPDPPPDSPPVDRAPGLRPRAAPVRTDVPQRPPWARRLDRLSLRLARLLRLVLPRPDEEGLESLARADRGPRPEVHAPDVPGIDQARRAFAEGRHGEALHLFGEILAADPDSAWAWHGRGDALQLLGQHEDALAAYTRAADLAPREGLHRAGCANALTALGRDDQAAAAWTEALRLEPSLRWMQEGRPPPG